MNFSDINDLSLDEAGDWPLGVKLVALLLIISVVVGIGYYLDNSDQRLQLQQAEAQEPQLLNTLQVKAKKAANLAAYEEQLAQMRESFGSLLRQLPNRTEVAELLVDISQTGLASGLEFELFRPAGEQPQEFYAVLPINMRVRGSFHEFGEFISGLAALPRIVTVHNISITGSSGSNNSGGTLSMEMTARTYRYLDESEGS